MVMTGREEEAQAVGEHLVTTGGEVEAEASVDSLGTRGEEEAQTVREVLATTGGKGEAEASMQMLVMTGGRRRRM